jgi:pilus assembly protein Flp/PilA
MSGIQRFSRRLAKDLTGDTRGANLVEYIILVGVIALIAIVGFKKFGGSVRAKVDEQAGSVSGINGAAK